MIALIMAGGSGTRFWPLSRENKPKQFLKIFNEKSMIRLTYERCLEFTKKKDIYVVTTESQIKLINEHLPELTKEQIIIEPCGRNTAPCIALATVYLNEIYNQYEKIIILPADHYIPDTKTFKSCVVKASMQIKDNRIITFGITPTYPATGYGYIEAGEEVSKGMFLVKHFKEKPDMLTATAYLSNNTHIFWNSGMFCCSISTLLYNFEHHNPYVLKSVIETILSADKKLKFDIYSSIPKTPVDIAILEVAKNIYVLPANFAWSDVGNWFSLSELMPKDSDFNYFNNLYMQESSTNNFVLSNKFTALLGVSDLVVVDTEDSLLIMHKSQAEQVKYITEKLKSADKEFS